MDSVKSLNRVEMPTPRVLHAPGAPSVADLVAQQAVANPSAIAVCAGNEVLSYADLDRRANRLAHYLRPMGVGRDTAGGPFLERLPALVVAALAVFKTGGGSIPRGPGSPAGRPSLHL